MHRRLCWPPVFFLAALLMFLPGIAASAHVRTPAPGDLDTTFNGTGQFVQGYNGWVSAMAVDQGSSHIVFTSFSPSGLETVNLNSDGTFDSSFGGGDGIAVLPPPPSFDVYPNALAIDSLGRIVVVGTEENYPHDTAFIVRLLSDGSPDTSFSGDGVETFSFGTKNSSLEDVIIGPGDKIIASGRVEAKYGYSNMLMVRLNSNGAVDTTFSGDGIMSTAKFPRQYYGPSSVALQPDGKIVVSGDNWSSNPDFGVMRVNPKGSLDTSFSGDGVATVNLYKGFDWSLGLGLLPSGKIVLVGTQEGESNRMDVARFTPKGVLDKSFSGDGKTVVQIPNGQGVVEAAAVAPDGTMVFAGTTTQSFNHDMEVSRLTPDGALDSSFGTGGVGLAMFANHNTEMNRVVFMPDGRIVVGAGDNATPAIARFVA